MLRYFIHSFFSHSLQNTICSEFSAPHFGAMFQLFKAMSGCASYCIEQGGPRFVIVETAPLYYFFS